MNILVRAYTPEERERNRVKEAVKNYRYIYWAKEADRVLVSHEEYNRLSEYFETCGREVKSKHKTVRIEWWGDIAYRIDTQTRKYQPAMYVSQWNEATQKFDYVVYYTEMDAEKLERDNGAGTRGYNTLNELFIRKYKVDLEQAFGVLPVENGECWVSPCVKSVKQAIYYDRFLANKKLKNIYKADIKSAYPFAATGRMPNAHTAIEKAGRIAPTAEYPFAFYLNSGHVAEFEVFDTHELAENVWYRRFIASNKENCEKRSEPFVDFVKVPDDEEITVLMKASNYTLDAAIEKMFWIKENADEEKTRSWYKWMLNALIGYMRSEANNKQHYQGHLAAIIYCRVVDRMVKMADKLVDEGNTPFYFAIDCIMWIGKGSRLDTTEKKLGNFVREVAGVEGVVCGQGQYYLHCGDSTIEKHQGVSKSKYKEYNIQNMDDYIKKMGKTVIEKEVFDPVANKFIYKEVLK